MGKESSRKKRDENFNKDKDYVDFYLNEKKSKTIPNPDEFSSLAFRGEKEKEAFKIEQEKIAIKDIREAEQAHEAVIKEEEKRRKEKIDKDIEKIINQDVDQEVLDKIEYTTNENGKIKKNTTAARKLLDEQFRQLNPNATEKELDQKFRMVRRDFNNLDFENDSIFDDEAKFKEMAEIANKRIVLKSLIKIGVPNISETRLYDTIYEIGYSMEVIDNEIKQMKEALKKIDLGIPVDIPDEEFTPELDVKNKNNKGLGLINFEITSRDYIDNEKDIDELTGNVVNKEIKGRLIEYLGDKVPKQIQKLSLNDAIKQLRDIYTKLSEKDHKELLETYKNNHKEVKDKIDESYFSPVMTDSLKSKFKVKAKQEKTNEKDSKETIEISESTIQK